MAENVPMDGSDASKPLHGTDESSQQRSQPPHSMAAGLAVNAPTDASGQDLNNSGPSISNHENASSKTADTAEANFNTYRPYAVEEPDDEPDSSMPERKLPCLPDYFERWQRELVDSMDDLDRCDRNPGVKVSPLQKRGQKRKPASFVSSGNPHSFQSYQSKSSTRSDEASLSGPGLSPKRRRRRSKTLGDAPKSGRTVSLHDFREARFNGSSSSDLPSTNASSADTINESAFVDEMDID